jgi:hypothetical protein
VSVRGPQKISTHSTSNTSTIRKNKGYGMNSIVRSDLPFQAFATYFESSCLPAIPLSLGLRGNLKEYRSSRG